MVIAIPIGILGALLGSFMNVVVHRVPRGESIVSPGSHCPGCNSEIAAYDNLPVVSWLLLRGRCRNCGEKISARYPLVELLTALVFAAIALVNGFDTALLWELPLAFVLIAVAFIDLDHRIVPNKILLPAAIWGAAMAVAFRLNDLPELAIAGAGAFTLLLLAALIHPAGMGMGDVKLAGVMGLYLGTSVVPALLIAFLAGTIVGRRDARPRWRRRAQEGRSVCPLHGTRGTDRTLRRTRARGPVRKRRARRLNLRGRAADTECRSGIASWRSPFETALRAGPSVSTWTVATSPPSRQSAAASTGRSRVSFPPA